MKNKTINSILKRFINLGKSIFDSLSSIESPIMVVAIVIIIFWAFMAILAPAVVPYSPTSFHLQKRLDPPSLNHPFGTDNFGRDVFSRVLCGGRYVLIIAPSATLLGLALGIAIGLTSGYFGGFTDEIIMRIMDSMLALPTLLLAIMILAVLGQSIVNVILVIGLVFAPRMARVVRSAVLEVKPLEFVQAARARGESSLYIMVMEILPNITSPMLVEVSIRFAYAIFTAASLNFLGLGIPPPVPDWGLMVSEGRDYILTTPWMVIFPAVSISSLVVAANLLSDKVRTVTAGEEH